ncbi:MAG TPA: Zn-ribbon containing protein [Candidatus Pacearchaeota archaeon]|nr:Zn-ribbon containing protein [Candidatus Pacearchaeota archaeon]
MHQCVHCGEIYPAGSRAILDGCDKCGGHFFFYVREDQLERIKNKPIEIPPEETKKIEEDIREISGIEDEDIPIILDIESIRVTGEGKFEIDLVKLFGKNDPLVYKLEEGKYIIDLVSTLEKGLPKDEEK